MNDSPEGHAPSLHLLSPLTLRGITLKNRIAVSPMCQYSAVDGMANDWHVVHLGSRAVGGAALVIVEATAVAPEGRITPGDLGLWRDDQADALQRIAAFVAGVGGVPGIQLAHAGRKASHAPPFSGGAVLVGAAQGGWETVAPSAIPFAENEPKPRELDASGIDAIVEAFASAARRAVRAGFRYIEIHAAHGYLLHEFFSPLSNHRTDAYGGSFDNRIHLLLQVAARLRRELPQDIPLACRISATDWVEGGWDLDQSIALARALRPIGVDLIDVSSGGILPKIPIPAAPGYQVPFAAAIRRQAGIMTGAVGLITEAAQADEIIRVGSADIALLGRAMLREPYWALKAETHFDREVEWPMQYGYAVRKKR